MARTRHTFSLWSIGLSILAVIIFFAGFIMVYKQRHPPEWLTNTSAMCVLGAGPLSALVSTVFAIVALFKEKAGCLSWLAFGMSAGGIGIIVLFLWIALEALSGFR